MTSSDNAEKSSPAAESPAKRSKSGDNSSRLHLTVNRLQGSALTLHVDATSTVAHLKKMLFDQLDIRVSQQRIASGSSLLKADSRLGDVSDGTGKLELSLAVVPKAHATVHQVSVVSMDEDADIKAEIQRLHLELLQEADHADLVENTKESGYRMCGVYIVFKRGEECEIRDLDTDVEEYGGIPAWVDVVTVLPLNHWDVENGQLDVKQYGAAVTHDDASPGFSFHTEECHAPIGIPPDFCISATEETTIENGFQFRLGDETFKIMGASSLDEIRELGYVIGSEEPNVGSVDA